MRGYLTCAAIVTCAAIDKNVCQVMIRATIKTLGGFIDMILGKHLLIEQRGAISLLDLKELDEVLCGAARAAGATILNSNFHYFGKGCGYTGVVMLAESHISIHTWPEDQYAAIDIFMCGSCDSETALDYLKSLFPDDVMEVRSVRREPPEFR